MIIDKNLEIADATNVFAEAGTYLVGNQIDLGAAHRDPGNGEPLYLCITVDTAFTDGGDSAKGEFVLASDAAAAIATDGTASEHLRSGTFLKAALAAGKKFCWPLPIEGRVYERYLGLLFVVTTAGFDAGAISAFITKDPTGWQAYPDAQN